MIETQQIRIRREVAERLKELRLTTRESYSEIIERLLEDHKTLKAMQVGE